GSSTDATSGSRMDATLINFIEPTSLNQRKARTTRVQKNRVEIPHWMPTELWEDWRKHRGSKLTPVAENNAFRKLDALRTEGHDPTKIVRRSLEHGWAGLYADERGTETRADGTRPAFKPVGLIQRDTRTEEEIDADLREQMARFGMNPEILNHEVCS
ncbi:MAG: hypothetical protein J0L65_12620, partial [Xanthomonadales bacterium]|nr:hypothetical protein [Xanthomonadales bacterium]